MATKVKARLTKAEQVKLTANEELIQFYRQFPVIAAKDLLLIDLAWFQREILNDMFFKDFVLLVMGRAVGKSWIDAVFAVLYAMLYPKTKIGIIAPVFRQAEFIFDVIEELYEQSPYLRAAVAKSTKNKGVMRTTYRCFVKFKNGSWIEALPLGTGNKVRGRRYHIIIADEYAQIDEDIIKLVIRPMMNVQKEGIKNKFICSSSAFYAWNHLYLQFLHYKVMEQREPESYAVHEYNYKDVLAIPNAPFKIDMNIIKMQMADMTVEMFEMENLAKFPIEAKGFFPARLIESCVSRHDDGPQIHTSSNEGQYTMGIDAARIAGGDNFALSVIKLGNGMDRSVAYAKTLNGKSFQEMRDTIRLVLSRFPIVRIAMDPGGGGTTLKDLLSEPWVHPITKESVLPIFDMDDKSIPPEAPGIRSLMMVNFTQPMVNHLYQTLKADMQHRRFILPVDIKKHPDRELEKAGWDILLTKQELMLLSAEPAGNFFKFTIPEGKKKDRATAVALANYAANSILQKPIVEINELPIGAWA